VHESSVAPAPSASAADEPADLVDAARPEPAGAKQDVVPRPAPTRAAPAPKPNCQPPYWVDADGIKHFKRECNLGR